MKEKNTIKAAVQNCRSFLAELLFPRACFFCRAPKTLLCPDCESLCEISPIHSRRRSKFIADYYVPCAYNNRKIERLISAFKYEPFSRQLARPLAGLIKTHIALLDDKPDFSEFIIIPVPLSKKRLRWRGYNQSAELAKNLALFFGINYEPACLARTKETACQVGLASRQRLSNVADAFACQNHKKIFSKKILLVDDVITTGATAEECAQTLIKNGAKEVVAIAIARAQIGDT